MKLTQHDLDHLTAGMFIFIHAAERVVNELAKAYEEIDRDSQEYKQIRKAHGRVVADEWLRRTEKDIVLQAKGKMMHEWLDAAHKLLAKTDRATDVGLMSGHDDVSTSELFGAMINDSNFMVRLFLLNGNIHPDNYIKVESTLKALADPKHSPVRTELQDLFRPKV